MKIEAFRYKQKEKDIFVFAADPNYIRKLVKLSDISKSDKNFQRPVDEKRVQEIKNYIQGKDRLYKRGRDIHAKGYIPNAIVINLLPKKYDVEIRGNRTTILFPDMDKVSTHLNSIEVIDGQHRLLAFDDECKEGLKGDTYEMCFVAFYGLTDDEKKEIFMVLNERQKTVDKNILLRHKRLLNLLLDEEETRYEVISRLNSESNSPFHNRIIMAGEPIKYGLKATQVDEVLNLSQAIEKLIDANYQIPEKQYLLLRNYFSAWESVFRKVWFTKNNTLTKIAGFRFICFLFPSIYEILKKGKDFKVEKYQAIITQIKDDYFNDDFDVKKSDYFDSFQERSGTIKLARKIGKSLQAEYADRDDDIVV